MTDYRTVNMFPKVSIFSKVGATENIELKQNPLFDQLVSNFLLVRKLSICGSREKTCESKMRWGSIARNCEKLESLNKRATYCF